MDSLHIGSDELVYLETDKVSLTIKGKASHPNFQGIEYTEGDSQIKLRCLDEYSLFLKGDEASGSTWSSDRTYSGSYPVFPLFFEQQRYELIIEAIGDCQIEFWHENYNVRNKITKVGRNNKILSGILNFGNEIGLSDLVVIVDGEKYLQLTIEVFPSKIDYRADYKAIVDDVTKEVYNVVFDFLKKTYLGYRQSEHMHSSPVEFFAVIRKIFDDFIRAADMILVQPHHILETTHQILPQHKVKRVDNSGIRWIEKHPEQTAIIDGKVLVSRALAVKKQITYDTRENRLIKYILLTTEKKLEMLKQNYLHLRREEDKELICQIDNMIQCINRRSNASFFRQVGTQESSAGMSFVLSMAPGYRELYKYYLMLLHGLSITGDVFRISVKDLALLYEYWCFIKLNSMMKERYELISQDIVKVQGNGLYISLVKGHGSRVKYRNPLNGEIITLSYNPQISENPTGTQRPDNVLKLQKKGTDVEYEYVFDAKYRVNPALPGTDYYTSVSHLPGPEVSDINTMHRYRDAIVYRNGASPYERTMFGAYVLFPYSNEDEYTKHRFYESIKKVYIGGLPFLPSAMKLVSGLLDELITDSPESAFERTTLPVGIEAKLKKVDWSVRDVLIGDVRSKEQFQICMSNKFYYIPVSKIHEKDLPVRYIAFYQSNRLFGSESGVRYYGAVTQCYKVKRSEIREIPSESEELYYRFEIKEWKKLAKTIAVREHAAGRQFTNMFLLEHSNETPELSIRSEEQYRLFAELKRALNNTEINDCNSDIGFTFNKSTVMFEDGNICVYRDGHVVSVYAIADFIKTPNAVFRSIHDCIIE